MLDNIAMNQASVASAAAAVAASPGPSTPYHQNIMTHDYAGAMAHSDAAYPHTTSHMPSNGRAASMQYHQNLTMAPQPTVPANGQQTCDIFYPHTMSTTYMPPPMNAYNQRSLPIDQQLSMASLQHFEMSHGLLGSNNDGGEGITSNQTRHHHGPQLSQHDQMTSQQFSFDQLQPMRIEPPIDANHFNDFI